MGKTNKEYTTEINDAVDKLRPIDDVFFYFLASDKSFCQEILRVILERQDIVVVKTQVQKNIRNIMGRAVTVDVLCTDSEGRYYNIEVQKDHKNNDQRRVRYNSSNVDTHITRKGIPFDEIPDVCVIYISSYDVFNLNKTIYHVDRVLRETNKRLDNGLTEVYVNTQVNDSSDIAELMGIFKSCEIPDNSKFPNTCKAIRHFKIGKGRENMCDIVENVAKETHQKTTKNIAAELLKEGVSDALILKSTKLSTSELEEIKAQLAKAEIS